MKKENIVRYTRDTVPPDTSDWARVDALTDEDIDRAIVEDPDAAPIMTDEQLQNGYGWDPASGIPFPDFIDHIQRQEAAKQKAMQKSLRTKSHTPSVQVELDADIVAALKKAGRGYKQKINQILRDYLNEHPELSQD